MAQSPELTEFYRAYQAWLDVGAPHRMPFSRSDGLCDNLMRFGTFSGANNDRVYRAYYEMRVQFTSAGLCSIIPFDDAQPYCYESPNQACHLNKSRVAWVREHAA